MPGLFIALCMLFAALRPSALAQYEHVSPLRTQYCSQGNLCLTSFDWCQPMRIGNESQYTITQCDYSNIRGNDDFLTERPFLNPVTGPGLYVDPYYNLTWINADSNYPVRIEWAFGPGAMPHWDINTTESSYRLRFTNLRYEAAQRLDNATRRITDFQGYSKGWINYVTISQPERPVTAGINTTDRSNGFTLLDNTLQPTIASLLEKQSANDAAAHNAQIQKWRIGVGVGVGLGVPILLILTYFLGRRGGKAKKATTVRKEPQSADSSS